jgi:hypothetical protein
MKKELNNSRSPHERSEMRESAPGLRPALAGLHPGYGFRNRSISSGVG